jgi:hypothetical protein
VTDPKPATRKLFLETDGACRKVIEIGDDEESRAAMLELGWIRIDLAATVAQQGAAVVKLLLDESAKPEPSPALAHLRPAWEAGNGGGTNGHHIPDLDLPRDVLIGETEHGDKVYAAHALPLTPVEVLDGVVKGKEAATGKLPSERIGERYEERLAILARANGGAPITQHEQATAHMLAIEDVLNERLGHS